MIRGKLQLMGTCRKIAETENKCSLALFYVHESLNSQNIHLWKRQSQSVHMMLARVQEGGTCADGLKFHYLTKNNSISLYNITTLEQTFALIFGSSLFSN